MHTRYRIANPIGQGGMGTIYRAYDRLTRTWVALKQLYLDAIPEGSAAAESVTLRRALAEEFRLLATLRHPHIVSVLDYGFVEGQAFFAMELFEAAPLLLEAATGLGWEARLQLLSQMLQALEYVRRHQVVHRDLKPTNVMVHQGQVKILDFGLAMLEGQFSTSVGSVFYMAPEAFRNEPLTHAADLFAVGVMAYEILAGHHPFEAHNLDEAIEKICRFEPDFKRLAGPTSVRAVIAQLLAKDPAARFPTAHAALAALSAASGLALPLETQATRASLIQAAKLVGREPELAQLRAALQAALAGQGGAVWVSGENGVGKSRLLEELRIQALVGGAQVWQGQAVSEGGLPGQLWRPVLAWLALLTTPNDLEAASLKPFVPELEALLGRPVPEVAALDDKTSQDRFSAVVLTLLRQAAAQQPVVIILEDVQWAGAFSRGVLAWLLRAVSELPVLLVATYRSDEEPNLPATLPPAPQLALSRLDQAQVAALASAILGVPPETLTTLVAFLYQQTEGNALFVVEVLRSLAEEAGLLSQVQHLALPEQLVVGGVQSVMQRRLQRVAAEDYAWLELAAVTGRQLDLVLLQHLDQHLDWTAWLNRCTEVAVLEPQGAGWRFAHDQLRQALLSALSVGRQRTLHHLVAAGLEQVYAQALPAQAARLAYHYLQTDEADKQRHYLWLAGQMAQAAHDYAKAAEHYGRLAQVGLGFTDPLEFHLRYGVVLEVLGRWAEADTAYHAALTLSTQRQDALALARSQNALGKLSLAQGNYPAALRWLAEAQAQATTSGSQLLLARIAAEMGMAHMRLGNFSQAEAHLETSLALAQAEAEKSTAAFAMHVLGTVTMNQGQYALAQTLYEGSLALRRTLGDKQGIANTLNNLGILSLRQQQYAQAQQFYEQSLAIREELGDKDGLGASYSNLGDLAILRGDYASAKSLLLTSLELRRAIGNKYGICIVLSNLGLVAYWQGAGPEARQLMCESLALSHETGQKQQMVTALVQMAGIYALLGQVGRAVQLAAAGEKLRETMGLTLEVGETQLYENALAAAHAVLSPTDFAAAWAAGTAMPLEEAIALALTDGA